MSGGYGEKFNPLLGLGYPPPRLPTLGEIIAGTPPTPVTLADVLGLRPPTPVGLGALSPDYIATLLSPPRPTAPWIIEALTRAQRWDDAMARWARPASETETGRLDRADRMLAAAVRGNAALVRARVKIGRQGSYENNTNERRESDVDLRADLPVARMVYAPGVVEPLADLAFGYNRLTVTAEQLMTALRTELVRTTTKAFGATSVDTSGTKAIRISGVTNSRAHADLVPAMKHHLIDINPATGLYTLAEGIAILGTDGKWTISYPAQHRANAITKNDATHGRFKDAVRILKNMRTDMSEKKLLALDVSSFFIECLVYNVESPFFAGEPGAHYERVRRILERIQAQMADVGIWMVLKEINGINPLFGWQAWTTYTAASFAQQALKYLDEG